MVGVLPLEDERDVVGEYRNAAIRLVVPHLSREQRRRLLDVVTDHLTDPENFCATPRIVHADFSLDHVLVEGPMVTGILDWGDVSLGDADYDFSYLYQQLGEAFVRELALHYGHRDPDRLIRKCYYYSIADQIGTIIDGDHALPGQIERSWDRLRELLGMASR
jgi:hypothetical protein